ncbi:MAG: CotH kinase family protein [Deltaproteobacteria bacterium]|nr:CotH kinase family protein [Deltaproteobacteria bacterium]MBN2672606.1 CotH kinase family protein [Deltaproteobacteria bacterium]
MGNILKMRNYIVFLHGAVLLTLVFAGCERDGSISCDGDSHDIERPDFWSVQSHCRGVLPDYQKVFDEEQVHEIDITVSPEMYQAMRDNLDYMVFTANRPADLDGIDNPITVPVEIGYDGYRWTDVGMRYKGHSSLFAAWQKPTDKLSFILSFDAYEESKPSTDNQRFFGFKRLIFSNNYNDPSFIRDKVAGEIYRAAGLPVVRSVFAAVYIDHGEGREYMGLYTMLEDAADKMLETQFGDYNGTKGNLYKPWGDAARWRSPDEEVETENSNWWEDDIESHFVKSTNEDTSDWSDVMQAIQRLHAEQTDAAQWRTELEEVFDVDSFIRYLAVSRVIMNWDSYGCMHHNYYIYANPNDHGRITWFPWDLGETMYNRQDASCLDLDGITYYYIVNPDRNRTVDTYWPLIQNILGDSVYLWQYWQEVDQTVDGPFNADFVISMMERYHDLIAPYIVGPIAEERSTSTTCTSSGCEDFVESLTEGDGALIPHVHARHAVVEAALEGK